MGTNYYTANEGEFNRHVGKSSAGWRFLASADGMGTWEWSELRERIERSVVIDEYGDRCPDLVSRIEWQATGQSHLRDVDWPEWMDVRLHKEDGPVDFTEGEFS